ncbi:MAG: FkbM family methyltransferase [Kiritimatiellia bacterium]|jgi:FkbM family methyltransferase
MKQLIKKALNEFFMRTLSYRLIHDQFVANSDMDVWESLKARGFSPRMLLDVGAAIGGWTSQMVEIFPESKYLMIDPLEENETALKTVVQRHSNVQYWLGAVGNQTGELTFHVHGDQSSMFNSNWGREGTLRRVPMRTLDDLVSEIHCEGVDGMKLDVQGAEIEVLKGATEALRQCRVAQVEVSFRKVYEQAPLAHEIIAFFSSQNFRIFDIASLYKRKDRALLQADLFFVRDDRLFEPEKWAL